MCRIYINMMDLIDIDTYESLPFKLIVNENGCVTFDNDILTKYDSYIGISDDSIIIQIESDSECTILDFFNDILKNKVKSIEEIKDILADITVCVDGEEYYPDWYVDDFSKHADILDFN